MAKETKGRVCGWCGKPGGTPMTFLRMALDVAGVKTKTDSPYFHSTCAVKAKEKLNAEG